MESLQEVNMMDDPLGISADIKKKSNLPGPWLP